LHMPQSARLHAVLIDDIRQMIEPLKVAHRAIGHSRSTDTASVSTGWSCWRRSFTLTAFPPPTLTRSHTVGATRRIAFTCS